MRRIVIGAWFAATLVLQPAQAQDEPPASVAVDRVLGEWRARSAAVTSLEVRFRSKARSKARGETESEGRAILASPNLAMLEVTPLDGQGKPGPAKHRFVWTGKEVLFFEFEPGTVLDLKLRDKWPAAPEFLRLPFLFRMTAEEAKARYEWKVLQEDPGRILLSAKPLSGPARGRPWCDRCIIELDPKTYLTKKLIVSHPGTEDWGVYEAVAIQVNGPVDLDELKSPCLDSWKVTEHSGWVAHWILR